MLGQICIEEMEQVQTYISLPYTMKQQGFRCGHSREKRVHYHDHRVYETQAIKYETQADLQLEAPSTPLEQPLEPFQMSPNLLLPHFSLKVH